MGASSYGLFDAAKPNMPWKLNQHSPRPLEKKSTCRGGFQSGFPPYPIEPAGTPSRINQTKENFSSIKP
jgi:hypothetical protein